jgi:hypothetical protein
MIVLKNVRLSYPALFAPSAFGDGEPKFNATFLIEKDSEQHKALMAEIRKIATDAFGERARDIVGKQEASQRKLVKDGDGPDGKNQDGEEKDGYAGHVAIKASNKAAPKVVGRQRQPLTEADGIPYGGCYVNAQIDIWPQDNKYGKFLNCKLLAVQFWEDGDSFGGGARADLDAFDADDGGDVGGGDAAW